VRRLPLGLAFASLVLLALSPIAFWPQYLSRLDQADGSLHAHAVLGALWLGLLVAQPLLIHWRRVAAHRALGRAGALVGAAFCATGVLLAHRSVARMTPEQLAREGYFLYLPLSMAVIFGAALLLGLVWRRVPALHGRFMACTALPLLDPLLARILYLHFPPLPAELLYQVPAFALAALVLIGLAVALPPSAPGRSAFRAFAGGTVVLLLLYFATPYSSMWFAFVQWFRALPLS
jgi:hypothetical protein